MGIRSTENWSGIRVNGVTLGVPAPVNPVYDDDGNLVSSDGFHWDGGVPNGVLDNDLKITPDGTDEQGDPHTPVDLRAISPVEIAAWTQPEGAHDAYPEGSIVEVGGVFWVSTTPANVWAPGVSGWRRISTDAGEVFEWVQPTGAHDAYPLGAKVAHDGQTWENTGSDANVWEPGVFGWTVV